MQLWRITFEAYDMDSGFVMLLDVLTSNPDRTADALRGLPNIRDITIESATVPVVPPADFEPVGFVVIS